MAVGREFQNDDLENASLIFYKCMQGRGRIKLFGSYALVDLVKSERMYSGVSPLGTLIRLCCILVASLAGKV